MTLGAVSHILWPEGTDVVLIDRPLLPTGAAMVSGDLTGNYTASVFDLDSTAPTTDILNETGATAATASTSNVSTEPLMQTAVQATTATYGGIWQQDATGYTVLYRILQSDLTTAMEGGHTYKVEILVVTTLYGNHRMEWLVYCVPLLLA